MPLVDQESFIRSLEEMGEEAVRRTLSRGAWNPQKVSVAEFWLAEREDARTTRSNKDALDIARSAKNAAWAAAIAAIVAIPIAIAAILISLRGS